MKPALSQEEIERQFYEQKTAEIRARLPNILEYGRSRNAQAAPVHFQPPGFGSLAAQAAPVPFNPPGFGSLEAQAAPVPFQPAGFSSHPVPHNNTKTNESRPERFAPNLRKYKGCAGTQSCRVIPHHFPEAPVHHWPTIKGPSADEYFPPNSIHNSSSKEVTAEEARDNEVPNDEGWSIVCELTKAKLLINHSQDNLLFNGKVSFEPEIHTLPSYLRNSADNCRYVSAVLNYGAEHSFFPDKYQISCLDDILRQTTVVSAKLESAKNLVDYVYLTCPFCVIFIIEKTSWKDSLLRQGLVQMSPCLIDHLHARAAMGMELHTKPEIPPHPFPGNPADTCVVALSLNPAQYAEGAFSYFFEGLKANYIEVCGIRTLYPEKAVKVEDTVPCDSLKRSLLTGNLAFLLKGFDVLRALNRILGPRDPKLARLTDPQSVNAIYGLEVNQPFMIPPATNVQPSRQAMDTAFAFGGRLDRDAIDEDLAKPAQPMAFTARPVTRVFSVHFMLEAPNLQQFCNFLSAQFKFGGCIGARMSRSRGIECETQLSCLMFRASSVTVEVGFPSLRDFDVHKPTPASLSFLPSVYSKKSMNLFDLGIIILFGEALLSVAKCLDHIFTHFNCQNRIGGGLDLIDFLYVDMSNREKTARSYMEQAFACRRNNLCQNHKRLLLVVRGEHLVSRFLDFLKGCQLRCLIDSCGITESRKQTEGIMRVFFPYLSEKAFYHPFIACSPRALTSESRFLFPYNLPPLKPQPREIFEKASQNFDPNCWQLNPPFYVPPYDLCADLIPGTKEICPHAFPANLQSDINRDTESTLLILKLSVSDPLRWSQLAHLFELILKNGFKLLSLSVIHEVDDLVDRIITQEIYDLNLVQWEEERKLRAHWETFQDNGGLLWVFELGQTYAVKNFLQLAGGSNPDYNDKASKIYWRCSHAGLGVKNKFDNGFSTPSSVSAALLWKNAVVKASQSSYAGGPCIFLFYRNLSSLGAFQIVSERLSKECRELPKNTPFQVRNACLHTNFKSDALRKFVNTRGLRVFTSEEGHFLNSVVALELSTESHWETRLKRAFKNLSEVDVAIDDTKSHTIFHCCILEPLEFETFF